MAENTRYRLGDFRMLAEPLEDALVVELNKAVPDFEDRLYNFATALWTLIQTIEDRLEHYIDFIKKEAELKGLTVRAERACDHRKTCMTCLGKFNSHYPYFRVIEKKPILLERKGLLAFMKKSDTRRYIKKREVKDFLRSLGIPEERIKRFLQLCDFRDFLVRNYHCQIITFKWAGLSSIELEE